ncbi:hypothetical protein WN944_006041 [Citrus x changshan-huyou]|uniref:Secreted protein n=1 Tax=Citrus x changshan-huyou TaxID=2935761 RepID=A0AAP0MIH6_9ROSI
MSMVVISLSLSLSLSLSVVTCKASTFTLILSHQAINLSIIFKFTSLNALLLPTKFVVHSSVNRAKMKNRITQEASFRKM